MPTLDFKGKQFIYAHHLTVPSRTLEIDKDKSHTGENPSILDDNLQFLIEWVSFSCLCFSTSGKSLVHV
ncbi:MAG: hypothetical protein OXU23_28100 [Candidatus Poribacteria bacterium]|nr:hypothetical protein [Candidatus Poribacteria bacterium]